MVSSFYIFYYLLRDFFAGLRVTFFAVFVRFFAFAIVNHLLSFFTKSYIQNHYNVFSKKENSVK